ncbi:MAG: GNAT family N-acetyltransferase [Friedmanniella sp.]
MDSGTPLKPNLDGSSVASLRRLEDSDLPFAIAEHSKHFPDNVMARLGPLFLRQYYKSFLNTPFAVATVAEMDGEPCGYLVGVLDTDQHRRLLLRRHGVALLSTSSVGLALRPGLAVRLLARRTKVRLRRILSRLSDARQPTVGSVAVLSHIAVSEDARSRGVGRALVQNFTEIARASGAGRISLATLDGPTGAGPFYEAQGWEYESSYRTIDGRWIRLYNLPLTAWSANCEESPG